jgi:hypothetical protein
MQAYAVNAQADATLLKEVYWQANGAYQYKIDVSNDNRNWKALVDKTKNTVAAGVTDDRFSASGRYVRITINGLPSGLWASFYEFRIYSTNDLTDR